MGESSVHDRLFCRHQHSGSVHGYSAAELIRSRSLKCLKVTYVYWRTQIWLNSLSVANFGVFRFVWPCLDDSDDICDLSQVMDDSDDIILWPVMAYKMSQVWISDRLIGYYRFSVCLFFCLSVAVRPSDALGLKARVNKKGEFPPCGVGQVPQAQFMLGEICPPSNFTFHFVWMFVFAKNRWSDAYRFISFRLMCKTKIDKLFKHWTSKQTRSANSMSVLNFPYIPHYGFVAKRIARLPK